MTPVISARDIVEQNAERIGSVPHVALPHVCSCCLGPVVGFTDCYGCNRLFACAPFALRGRVVPMTTAVNPGLWYRSLVNYKNGVLDDHTLVAAVISSSVAAHGDRIAELLGGELQRVVVVPSTRGRPFDSYPLARAVRRIKDIGDLLTNSLSHVQGETIQRDRKSVV